MEITTEEYRVVSAIDHQTTTVIFEGELRLPGIDDYESIAELLNQIIVAVPTQIILDLRQLRSLNSSGIIVLATFVIDISEQEVIEMTVQGSQAIVWQTKALKNFHRLMPKLQLEWE
jgi:hypothetical protein